MSSDATLVTPALLVRRTEFGEADLIVSFFTEALGLVSAVAAHARRSQRRFGGSLEPFHTLRITLRRRPKSELWRLVGSELEQVRTGICSNLARLGAASRWLGWVRSVAAPETPEPDLWALSSTLLGELESPELPESEADRRLAEAGLLLLVVCGWRLELERCVATGKPCPPGKAARVDPARGGLIARGEGVAPFTLSGEQRHRLSEAQAGQGELNTGDASVAIALIEATLAAHAGLRSSG